LLQYEYHTENNATVLCFFHSFPRKTAFYSNQLCVLTVIALFFSFFYFSSSTYSG